MLGSLALGEVAGECGALAFILISTDKAVRPSSVMGATKRVAELVVQGLGHRYKTRYVFTCVRPGEKLFEELQYSTEAIDKTRHPKIFIGKIEGADEIRAFLGSFLPEAQLNGGLKGAAVPSAD